MRLLRAVAALAVLLVVTHAASIDSDSVAETLTPAMLETRQSTRHEDPLSGPLEDRASLLFRALDKDSDRHISAQDVQESEAKLLTHMPGVSVTDFESFIEIADLDGDHKLSRDELFKGLADGVAEAASLPAHMLQHPSASAAVAAARESGVLLETDAQRRDRGIVAAMAGAALGAAGKKIASKLMGALTGKVDISQDGCVMCQYITERCEANVKQSGVIPGLSSHVAFDSFLELQSRQQPNNARDRSPSASQMGLHDMPPLSSAREELIEADAASAADESLVTNTVAYAVASMDDAAAIPSLDSINQADSADYSSASLLETESKQFFDHSAAGVIGATRQTTRVQRQLERQKYNEIYRVVDISLDDVCEQGMPNAFYGFCKQIYKLQTDVVDGLRYQYRPADICFRIGMCGKKSYITKGIHTRYK